MLGSDLPQFQPLEWTDENVGRFWRWQAQFPETYFTYQFGHRIVQKLRGPLAGSIRVIDYGCGPGFLIPHLVALGKEVTATDYSPEAVAKANHAYPIGSHFKGAFSVDALVESKECFDAAISVEVIEHLNDHHLSGFFRNLRTLLRPDGIALITTPNEEDLSLSNIYCPESDRVFHRWQHVRSWSAQTLADRIALEGFVAERIFTTDFSESRFGNVRGKVRRLAKWALGQGAKRPHLVCIARWER